MAETKTREVVTAPTKPVLTPVDQFRVELERGYARTVANYFEGDKEKTMKFMSAVVRSVQKIPELLHCERGTLMTAFMSAAEYQLYPSSVSGEAYVLPYKGKAQFQLGYQGVITLLYRAGISSIRTNIVYEHDDFQYEEGLEAHLVHKPDMFAADKGKAIGVYAVAEVNGTKLFKVMSAAEVMKFREFSQGKSSEYSPWNAKNDPELHMWRKTVIKQLAKTLPKNDTIAKAFAQDNEESVIASRTHRVDVFAEGKRPVDMRAQIIHLLTELDIDTSDPEQTREEITRLTSLEAVPENFVEIKGRLQALVAERIN